MKLENLKVEDLSSLAVDQLSDAATLTRIEELASDSVYDYEPGVARDFYDTLDSLLQKFGKKINGTSSYTQLNNLLVKLGWQSLQTQDKKFKEQSLSNNLIYAIKKGTDINRYIQRYLDLFEFNFEPDLQERQIFLDSLVHNQERLGNNALTLKSGDSASPTINNWIRDFISYSDPKSLKGGAYELTQYVYSSPNVKKLNPEDKQILSKIIKIYIHLQDPKYIPEPGEEQSSIAPQPEVTPAPVSAPRPISFAPTQSRTFPQAPRPSETPAVKPVAPSPKRFAPAEAAQPGLNDFVVRGEDIQMDADRRGPVARPTTRKEEMTPEEKAYHEINKGMDLEVLRTKMVNMPVEKTPSPPAPLPQAGEGSPNSKKINFTPAEIKREISTKELSGTVAPKPPAPHLEKPIIKPVVVAPILSQVTQIPKATNWAKPDFSVAKKLITSLDDIRVMDDLKKITPANLRQGKLESQILKLKSKIISMAQLNNVYAYYAVAAFEESPLFKSYLQMGASKIGEGESKDDLSLEEFEAMADLRKEIESL